MLCMERRGEERRGQREEEGRKRVETLEMVGRREEREERRREERREQWRRVMEGEGKGREVSVR